jgi:GNAT superfamily N-acetyltransferase
MTTDEAARAIHLPTILLLFAFMVVSAQMRLGGFYTEVTRRVVALPLGERGLLGMLIFVAGALSAVGLGTVPSWLRPFHVLSMGERFRAEMARIIIDEPEAIVVDEFTSVVDRQIARIGAAAFAKAWRRRTGQVVLLSCHRDIEEWLCPDWILDTEDYSYRRGCLQRRPQITLSVYATNWRPWAFFEPHHYLKLPHMIGATNYVALHRGEPVAHVAVATTTGLKSARMCRLVVMPEWQGAGVGLAFINHVAGMWLAGNNRYSKPITTVFQTSHPGMAAALAKRLAPVAAASEAIVAARGDILITIGSANPLSHHQADQVASEAWVTLLRAPAERADLRSLDSTDPTYAT